MKLKRSRELAIYGTLAAFSAVFQIFHLGVQVQWGMWIDIVGVSWIVAFFLFGLRGGLIVSLVGSIIITLIAPDTWLGATAKLLATLPMILVPFAIKTILKAKMKDFENIMMITLALVMAIMIRGAVMVIFNYYFALPIWVPGKSTTDLVAMFPWYIIAGINALQATLEMTLAWALVFKGKLSRYGTQ